MTKKELFLEESVAKLTAQVLALQFKVGDLTLAVSNREATIVKEKEYGKSQLDQRIRAENELGEMHTLLDSMVGCMPRRIEGEHSWNFKEPTPMTRLASWLCSIATSRIRESV